VNFNEYVWPGLPGGVTFAADAEQLHRALARAPAVGMTALFDAVDRALDHLQRGTRDRKALVVVSDGADNASGRTLADVIEHARRTDAVIYGVMVYDPDTHDAKPDVLRRLARETGGDVFTPKNVRGVMDAFARIGREIRTGYTIGFAPPAAPDGGFRAIRVVADAGDGRTLIVRTRAGYYAARNGHGTR
jgi:VWFA-related protein